MLKGTSSRRGSLLLLTGSFVCASIHSGYAFAQQAVPGTSATERVKHALRDLAAGSPDSTDAGVLADGNVTQAIPSLEKKFEGEVNLNDKAEYAAALVKLQDGKPLYWNYLSERAEDVLKDTLPLSAIFDADGQQRATRSEAFGQWASRQQLASGDALEKGTILDPTLFALLASTRDRRAIPLLERALSSDNYLLHVGASIGLVELDDPDAISRIPSVLKRDPPSISRIIAGVLAWSSNPDAQQAAATYLPKEELDEVRKQKAAGRTMAAPSMP